MSKAVKKPDRVLGEDGYYHGTMPLEEFAEAWDVSRRTAERYTQQGGLPTVKDQEGRTLVVMPGGGFWMQKHLIADAVRRANPGMSRREIRVRTLSAWLEMQDEHQGFDINDDETEE